MSEANTQFENISYILLVACVTIVNRFRAYEKLGGGGEVGGAPYDGAYTGKLRPKGVPFSGFRYYERVGISLVEVCIRVGKSVIWVCERAQNG